MTGLDAWTPLILLSEEGGCISFPSSGLKESFAESSRPFPTAGLFADTDTLLLEDDVPVSVVRECLPSADA